MSTRTDDAIRMGDATAELFTDCVELAVRVFGKMSSQQKQKFEREYPEGYKGISKLMSMPQLATEVAERLRLLGTWEAMSPQQKQHFKREYPNAYRRVEEFARVVQREIERGRLETAKGDPQTGGNSL